MSQNKDNKEFLQINRRSAIKAGLAFASSAALLGIDAASAQSSNQQQTRRSAPVQTLLIASHPYPERSIVNKALQQAAENIENIHVRNLESLYGFDTRAIDVAAERAAYDGMERLVFMFPIHWFNLAPMMKAYFNEVWTIWAPENLQGREMFVVTTAGAASENYTHEGRIGCTIEEIVTPFRASANYAGLKYSKQLSFLGVANTSDADIISYQQRLIERLCS